MDWSIVVALVVGTLQGIFEWLPISSEGNLAIALSALGRSPDDAVAFALFLHLGTALSATAYYRHELRDVLELVPAWRPSRAFEGEQALVTFLAAGTLVSGVVGIAAYATLDAVVSSVTGGTLVVLVGVLLVATGLFQLLSGSVEGEARPKPRGPDAVLVGALQGLAILPGVSRSGVTAGALLLRGYDGPTSFRLSFLLSIPAAVGGGLLAFADTGLGDVTLLAAAVALGAAATVGYATIDALMRLVERVSFWGVCLALGLLAIAGGILVDPDGFLGAVDSLVGVFALLGR
ncbi:undecaprenyl-diphosphate phosphatase [Halapricum hydrolyticum]|uniref:Undecaprenyl-diphosphatase n=1 Tax=Halapricum hydrolyticum TaxID=2979991 RepID=A0AAE3IAX6_9EURY|nr:undecaprenyl-diphosphate phosphatase [Halapricum hydrolyticum]MCU4718166.1 undecaprenyl-diphosphate phosphatase [Halapricum hydrolyticum]MCU4726414.1 undecaprenyl-diphosphate phosphatase [Halapricum hydrolyticum]